LWTRDFNSTRQRCGRATAKRLFIRIRNIRDQLAPLIITLHACETNSINAIEPETPYQLCVTRSRRRKLLEEIITTHHSCVLFPWTTSIGFFVEEFALDVDHRTISLDGANHERICQ